MITFNAVNADYLSKALSQNTNSQEVTQMLNFINDLNETWQTYFPENIQQH
jgi:hypothetical protein